MSSERDYYVEHTVRMVVTELVTATSATQAIRLARAGKGEPVDAAVTSAPATNWNAQHAHKS